MQDPIAIRTTVLPGHRLEIVADELTVGETVEILIHRVAPAETPTPSDASPARPLLELFGSISAGTGLDNEQIDADLARFYETGEADG